MKTKQAKHQDADSSPAPTGLETNDVQSDGDHLDVDAISSEEKPSLLAQFRLQQDFTQDVPCETVLGSVPVRRPHRQWWFYAQPAPGWRAPVALIELEEESESLLVAPKLCGELIGEWVPKLLVTAQTRQGTTFLWPIKMRADDGQLDTYNNSALEIVSEHAGRWMRVRANRQAGTYDVQLLKGEAAPPSWPAESFEVLLERAFKNKIIDSLDHHVVRRLRGEV